MCGSPRLTATVRTATRSGTTGGYRAFEIANGAASLLDEVLKSKITGEEETYSRIALLSFEINVEGWLQAFATLKPALNRVDPSSVPQNPHRIRRVGHLPEPAIAGGWTPYDRLTDADEKALVDTLLVLQEPWSAVAQKVTGS